MNLLFKTLQVFIVRGFGAAAGFLMSLVVTNTTELHYAGVFFFALAMVQLGGGLMTLGSTNALLKVVGSDYGTCWYRINQDTSFILKAVFVLAILVGTSSLLIPNKITQWLGIPELAAFLPLVVAGMLLFCLIQIFAEIIQGKQNAVMAATVHNVIAQFSFIVLLGLLFWLTIEQTSSTLTSVYVLALSIATGIGAYAWFSTQGARFEFTARLSSDLKASLAPLFVIMLMNQCAQWAGQFATAKYLSSSDVAFFASAQRTATLASFVLIAVNLVVAPKFAQAFAKGRQGDVNKLSLLSSRLMMLLATPVLLFMIFLPEFLMGLFGEEYKVAAPLLQILAVGQFVNVITGSVGYLLNMTGHEKDMRNVVLFSGPLAIALALGLTSQFGLMGAAYATAISVATQNLLAVWMVKKRLGFNTLNVFRKV
ncbi:lipopolysaccharide biosynthesis protein [Vibrio coralliirubri]|uniref:lipopolysaccharide biosynthesis protein n=1 Tax=Vibrio coralliirubri TaxID=1516159 RepID=UPI000EFC44A1|nr:polysaccharide biosynthesis C-terminal domain-containing protein [Vibrio coralliirubri]